MLLCGRGNDARGVTVFQVTVVMSAFSVGAAISAFLGGRLADLFVKRFGEKGRIMLMQLYLVTFACTVALATQIPYEGSLPALAISFVLGLIFSIGFSGCVLPMVSNVVPYLLNAIYWFLFYRVYPRDVEQQQERTAMVEAGTF